MQAVELAEHARAVRRQQGGVAGDRAGLRNEGIARRLIVVQKSAETNRVDVSHDSQQKPYSKQQLLRLAFVPAGDPIHRRVEPTLEVRAKSIEVPPCGIQCDQDCPLHGSIADSRDLLADSSKIDAGRLCGGLRGVGRIDPANHQIHQGEPKVLFGNVRRGLGSQRFDAIGRTSGRVVTAIQTRDQRVLVQRARQPGAAGIVQQLPDSAFELKRPRFEQPFEPLSNGGRDDAQQEEDENEANGDVENRRTDHGAPRSGPAYSLVTAFQVPARASDSHEDHTMELSIVSVHSGPHDPARSTRRRSRMPRGALLSRIAIFSAFGTLAAPLVAYGQAPGPSVRLQLARRAIAAESLRLASRVQPATIPRVIGLTLVQAIDSLRWTRLRIVPRDSTTTQFDSGTVADQRPIAGTPAAATKAETLFIASRSKPPTPPVTPWLRAASSMLANVATPAKPPPSRAGSSIVPAPLVPTPTPTTTAAPPSRDSLTVPGTPVQQRTRVPNIYGSTRRMAAAMLEKNWLRLGKESSDYSDKYAGGLVSWQSRAPTSEVATFTTVDVTYSIGPHPVRATIAVPAVVGLTLTAATDSLMRVGLRAGHTAYLTRRGALAKVVLQAPEEGDSVHLNDAVDLTIAIAPKQVVVPNVNRLTRQDAQQRLAGVGLGVGTVTLVVRSGIDTGIVAQKPEPPATADSGSLVDLVENRPPDLRRVIVPNLVGRDSTTAASILSRDSLALGDVLRPAVNAVNRVVDQRPTPGDSAFMHTPVTVVLGTTSPNQLVTKTRIPPVVTLTLDSAHRLLASAGFTHLSISGEGGTVTSSSIVQSQLPGGNDFADPSALVSLVVQTRLSPLPVPKLIGLRTVEAQTATEVDGLHLVVKDRLRRLRLHDAVVRQSPDPGFPRRPDSSVDVAVEIPVLPPLAAALLGFGVVAGAGGAAVKVAPKRTPRPRGSNIVLDPVITKPTRFALNDGGRSTLIRNALTLRFGQDWSPWHLKVQREGGSIVKPEEDPND